MFLLTLFIFLNVTFASANHFWLGDTLSINQVRSQWGNHKFDMKEFRLGIHQVRASMAANLLEQKNKFKRMTVLKIKEKFGSPDGFYFTDTIPAYIIQSSNKKGDDVWQIVFSLDSERNVTDIFVHKSCCYD